MTTSDDFEEVEENPVEEESAPEQEDEFEDVEAEESTPEPEVKPPTDISSAVVPAPAPPIIPRGISQVIEANGPMALQLPAPNARGPWVKYIGLATVRIMDADAWKSANVNSTKYCEWNYLNKKRLPVSSFTDDELTYLLRRDGRFELVEEDK